jgi:hypothetical protein
LGGRTKTSGDEGAQQYAFGAHDANFFRIDLDALGERTAPDAHVTFEDDRGA